MSARLLRLAFVVGGVIGAGTLASCGAHTGLLVPLQLVDASALGTDADDAGVFPPDAPIPPIDATPGIVPSDCPDAGDTLIYLVTSESNLFSFYPPTARFARIGLLSCPTSGSGWQPFSMAVDRQGRAYVLFIDGSGSGAGQLFGVSTATAACTTLPYVGGQDGFETFGMGFVGNVDSGTETLYVAMNTEEADAAPKLAALDVANFRLSMVENISPASIASAELTGTGDGRLFAFYEQGASSAIAQLDPSNGRALGNDNLANLPQRLQTVSVSGWAFAFWGSDFYLFTTDPAGTGGSIITRFDPSDGSQTTVATLSELIVGAGVSTCAPQQ